MSGSREPIQKCILETLSQIRKTKAAKLPGPEFSNAINAVGEQFVDMLLKSERTGKWWLDDNGEWLECTVKRVGNRVAKNFLPGESSEWEFFTKTATRPTLADPLTGPDHVVSVDVPKMGLKNIRVVLEQKLRFGRHDVLANSSTYVRHLRAGLGKEGRKYQAPKTKDFQIEPYCNGLLHAAKDVLCHTDGKGALTYSGKVPHVCFVSICLSPNKIIVRDKGSGERVECDFAGFLPPCVNQESFTKDSPTRKIIYHAKVRLWIGLDTLLKQCQAAEVENAWRKAIKRLSQSVRDPQWR